MPDRARLRQALLFGILDTMKTRTAMQSIDALRRRYRRQWLLIDVQKLEASSTTPTAGRLLAHSASREDIYDRLLRTRARLPLVTYSEDTPPKGYAVAF